MAKSKQIAERHRFMETLPETPGIHGNENYGPVPHLFRNYAIRERARSLNDDRFQSTFIVDPLPIPLTTQQ